MKSVFPLTKIRVALTDLSLIDEKHDDNNALIRQNR